MPGTQIFRQGFTGNDLVKHSAIGNAIAVTRLHGKANDSPRKLTDNNHHPVRFQGC
jgi:hypothetical protein